MKAARVQRVEDFANLHPGGKLGKRLALGGIAVDAFRGCAAAGCAFDEDARRDYEMSRKKLGVTAVVEG